MKTKKVLSILLAVLLMATMLVGCGSNTSNEDAKKDSSNEGAKSGEKIVLRLADNHNEDYPTVKGDRKFAELVEKETDGRIKIEVYPGGQLGDEKTVIEQVQFGAIDMTRTSISPLTEFQKKLSVLMLPYMYRDREHMFKVLDSPIGDKFLNELEEVNMVGLCWFDAGARNFYNAKREVKSLDDLKGLKIRVQPSEIMLDLVKAVGASPTPMAFGEVYSGLQTGVIDGAENNWPSYLSTSHYEVAKYFTVDEHTRVPEVILMSKMSLDKLSSEDQELLKKVAKEAAVYERDEWLKTAQEAEKKIKESGNTITKLDDATKKQFQEAVKPLYDKYAGEYKDLIDEIINTK